ncbi:helix-turn-helix transcriptional regulator [Herbiconiux sp. CPCC 205763]|uniref:Helix-turn-helix transcriptional regulator n=1 Tax=Herbiconiux aconitum TaxID=2970913 RepID=A0ABT2GWP9_9MICO|nr:helix-turn-helix transcriptional regulator [Herbiconiux aconitum]MCS5719359.1 helix-turn-helix transcriptional regulator [Herbiconiux aconitum]
MPGDATLSLLGVTELGERIYREVVADSTTSIQNAARSFGLSDDRAMAELETLRSLGLVNRLAVDGEYSAVDPRFAIRVLADRTADQLNRIRDAVPQLAATFDDAQRSQADPSLSRIVSGADEVGGWYNRLEHQAGFEFLAFDRPPYVLATSNPLEEVVLGRGVVWRAVYAAASLDEESAFDDLRRLVAIGEEARVTTDLPVKMAIADRRIALVSLVMSGSAPVALVTEAEPLVNALIELFDSHWRRAVPIPTERSELETMTQHRMHRPSSLGGRDAADAGAPTAAGATGAQTFRPATDAERALLALFSTGLKDEMIARQLGVSARTVRRRSRELLHELGAANRFQAGAEAARRGWI